MHAVIRRSFLPALALCALGGAPATAQRGRSADSTKADSLNARGLESVSVSATRSDAPLSRTPFAVQRLDRSDISLGRPAIGLDESLALVPGVYAANRYNFSYDERISIRGFGARSAFALRGIMVLLDGIPETLPDGTGQVTNLELGESDRMEVLRGSSSALFGNASGGVISIWSDPVPPSQATEDVRVEGGGSGLGLDRGWTKWLSTTRAPVGDGVAQLTVSRFAYAGERQHSTADLRNINSRITLPVGAGWVLSGVASVGDDPRADNPGALTATELRANPDSAAAINITTRAGKQVSQVQSGVTLRRLFDGGGEAAITTFGSARDLKNPTTFSYIELVEHTYGVRASVVRPFEVAGLPQTLTFGADAQQERNDRVNFGTSGGQPNGVLSLNQLEHVAQLGPFVQSAVDLLPRVTLTGGARYDRTEFRAFDRLITATNPDDSGDRLMSAPSGSLGLNVRATSATTLYANVGTSFETPTTTELANRPDTAGGFNPSLNPQKATNYEVGARGSLATIVTYSAAVYQANVRDELISFGEPSSPGRVFYRNAGQARHRGVELGAQVAPVPGLSLAANWTLSDFQYVNYTTGTHVLDGRELPGIPPQWLDLVLHARPAFAQGGWADVEISHAASYLVDDTLNTRNAAWTTAAVRVGWVGQVSGQRVGPFVAVNNLFDKRYVSSVVINATGGRYYEPAPGRTVYLGLTAGVGQ
jgi:iron complex outermembrane recepter protein